jgi:hypothetical protein
MAIDFVKRYLEEVTVADEELTTDGKSDKEQVTLHRYRRQVICIRTRNTCRNGKSLIHHH